jgi:hypothetical protein
LWNFVMAVNVSLAVRISKRSVCRQVVLLRYTKCASIVSVGCVFVTVNKVRFCVRFIVHPVVEDREDDQRARRHEAGVCEIAERGQAGDGSEGEEGWISWCSSLGFVRCSARGRVSKLQNRAGRAASLSWDCGAGPRRQGRG